MYDIRHLESEWKKYRKKKLRVWYIFFLILVFLSIAVLFFINVLKDDLNKAKGYFQTSTDATNLETKSQNTSVAEEKNIKNTLLINDALKRLEVENDALEAADTTVDDSSGLLVDIPLLEESKDGMGSEIPKSRKKVHLEIIESTSMTAYKDVENRFHQSHDIDDALFLAKSYYSNGNFKKAEYWALQTNKLDETNEESLLIFVKSKVKLGNRNEAISILTSYVKKSNSQEASKLLYQIENNKL